MSQPAPVHPLHRGLRGLRDASKFLGAFVRNPKSIGAVAPSSRFLAEALVGDLADVGEGDLVLEYGPGTGPMTAVLHRRLPPGVRYLGIERDQRFVELLRTRHPDLAFHHGSVEDVERIVAEAGLGTPRTVISGLPFASLPRPVQEAVVAGTHAVLGEGGVFRTFQYVHAFGMASARRFRADMASRFRDFERSRPVLRNMPPAYVLSWRR